MKGRVKKTNEPMNSTKEAKPKKLNRKKRNKKHKK